MANTVVATKTGLALQIYAKTIANFKARNVFKETCTTQTITGGFSHRFNVMGLGLDTDIYTHGLGDDISTSQLSLNKRDIVVDRPLRDAKRIDNWEKKAANFDMVAQAVDENSYAMATKVDKLVLNQLDLAMDVPQLLAEDGSGRVVQDTAGFVTHAAITAGATAEAKGDALVEAMFGAGNILEGKNQFGKKRYFVTTPENYTNILLSKKAINNDYNSGSNGSIAEGKVLRIDDVYIMKSNNIQRTGLTTQGAGKALENLTLEGWYYTEDVIGITELFGIDTDSWEDKKEKCYYTDIMYSCGMGVLNPASLVAITA